MKNFVVYKSSAGSGKTFTLVREYLRLSLFDENRLSQNFRKILAVTFTNKAAAEMKERVLGALEKLSAGEERTTLSDQLCSALSVSRGELKRRSGILLGHILHNYSDFSISTIDSFTHRIVRSFAHDLQLPLNFNVELDVKAFYEKVLAALFARVGEDPYVSRLLREYALTRAEHNASWDPQKQMEEFATLIQKENSGPYIESLRAFTPEELEAFRKQFNDFIHYYHERLKELAGEAIELIAVAGLTDDDFRYKKSGAQGFFRKCLAGTAEPGDADSSRLAEAVSANAWGGSQGNAALDKISPQLSRIAGELISFIKANHRYYSLCGLLNRQMHLLMLLKKIEEISSEQKQEDRLVFISEFNRKIFDIINTEPAPFIYERLGERYQHYLVDEFQDTSSLQWQNIIPLLDNSLAGGWFNLVVGDGKQSIYRWRNANVRQFADLPRLGGEEANEFRQAREQALERNFREEQLGINFRSHSTIIDFNNSLFGHLPAELLSDENRKIYSRQSQEKHKKEAGYVTVHRGTCDRDELGEINFSLITQYIDAAIAHDFRLRDICILARTNNQGNLIATHLSGKGVPVLSSDSLLLRHSTEVNTLVAWLRYLLNPGDQVSAAAVVTYLHCRSTIDGETLHRSLARLSLGESLPAVLESCGVDLQAEDARFSSLADQCILLVKALRMTEGGYPYIRFFLDEVNDFMVQGNSSLSSFLEWWEGRSEKASMIVPGDADAVRIMTIHASKGLEFPVVIVPFCNWQVYRPAEQWVSVKHEKVGLPVGVITLSKKAADSGFEKEHETERQEQVLDNLNLLYVAFTRAVERLHVICDVAVTQKQETVAGWMDRHIAQIAGDAAPVNFTMGEPLPRQSREEHAAKVFRLDPLTFDNNPNTIKIKSSWMYGREDVREAIGQGLLVHALLSKVSVRADPDKVISDAILEGMVARDEAPALREKLFAITGHPDLARYFENGVDHRIEAELLTAEGETLRPDRVVFAKEETILIDYKTGGRKTSTYAIQLGKYAAALESMGYRNVRKLLVYVDEPAVVEVS